MPTKRMQNESLIALENSLKHQLHPVEPNQHFVKKLRTRLEKSPILYRQQKTAATLLTIAVGLLVGLAIFLIGRRFLQQSNES